jgi:ATP-dependent Clp protease ATP-binding subunit ClpA
MSKQIVSDDFKNAVRNSSLLSIALKNHMINTGHLLASVLELESSSVSQHLLDLVADKNDFLQAVRSIADTHGKLQTESPSWLPAGSIALTDEAEKVVLAAQANGIKSGTVELHHLISALVTDEKCIAHSLFTKYFDIVKLKHDLPTWVD